MTVNKVNLPESNITQNNQVERVTYLGMVVNIVLALVKIIVGYASLSLGLIADGFHSFSDLGTDLAVLVGARLAGRPPDLNHPFGHGKFETIAAWGISIILILIGAGITYKGFVYFLNPQTTVNGLWVIIVAVISLLSKEILYQLTARAAVQTKSHALHANAWHHRSDAFSSAVVLVGGIAGMMGWSRGDSVAGLLVGVMVIMVGGKLGFEALMELSEASPGRDVEDNLRVVLSNVDEIRDYHRLRVRRIGRELEMDVHIVLDPDYSIRKGHEIVIDIENRLKDSFDMPINPVIHVDPDIEELRIRS